jgi:hypothetical protein
MKEQIVKILSSESNSKLLTYSSRQEYISKSAEEIESHVFEFVDWLISDKSTMIIRSMQIGANNSRDAYNYWFVSVYNKVSMLPVTSSQIKSMGFKDNTLYVEFNKGDVYSYKDVPDGLYVNLRFAESVGKFFASEVKGKYDYVKTDKKVVERELK